MKKRTLSFLLALVMCLFLLPMTALAAGDTLKDVPIPKPAAFADDKDISDWAKDSVYFMAANGIINGVGNNKFAPKNVTTEEQATGYANATREQALLIAVRMVENLGK